MYIHHFDRKFQLFYPSLTWRIKDQKSIYLTFDDGPIPEVTHWVLNTLSEFNAKATFFCVGENIKKHPEVFKSVLVEGHSVGNHTQNHYNGRRYSFREYIENINACDVQLGTHNPLKLFRPPYGRMTYQQLQYVKKNYKTIMWEVLTADFDPALPAETCLQKSIKYTKAGSIVLFHDSIKSIEKLKIVLPKYLKHFSDLGFQFKAIV